jgi:hypothetical protein
MFSDEDFGRASCEQGNDRHFGSLMMRHVYWHLTNRVVPGAVRIGDTALGCRSRGLQIGSASATAL